MKKNNLVGIGNAIVDILLEVSEETFQGLNVSRGAMELVSAEDQQRILAACADVVPVLVSGGSVANSIIAYAQLGGGATFVSCVADDKYGLHYQSEFEQLGIRFGHPIIVGGQTGTSVILVTPDSERSMCTHLGVAAKLGAENMRVLDLDNESTLFIEGYLLAADAGRAAVEEGIRLAKEAGASVAITCSAEFITSVFREPLETALAGADILFANYEEACSLAGSEDLEVCLDRLSQKVPHVVVTNGADGVHLVREKERVHVPAIASKPIDSTGAGDIFAGSYLYGIHNGLSGEAAASGACFLAHKVIEQMGARLPGDVKQQWACGLDSAA